MAFNLTVVTAATVNLPSFTSISRYSYQAYTFTCDSKCESLSVSISSYMALFSYWHRQISMTKWCNMASEKQHMGCGYLLLVSRDHVDIVSRSWSSQQNQASYNTLLYILGWSVDWDRKKYGKSQWSHRMQKGRPVSAAYIWHLHTYVV